MSEVVSLILAIFGAVLVWTTTIVTLTFWLATKFRAVEGTIYREMKKLDDKYAATMKDHHDRMMVLELKAFGSTVAGIKAHR